MQCTSGETKTYKLLGLDNVDQSASDVESNDGMASMVKIYRNHVDGSAPVFTSASTPVYPLFADASLYSTGATLQDVVLAGAVQQAVWSPAGSNGVSLDAGKVQ